MFSLSLQAICSFLTTPFQQDYAQHRRQLSTRRTTRSQQIFPSLPGCCCRSPSGSAAADVGLFGPPLSIYTPIFSSSSAMILCPSRVFMNHAHSGDIDDVAETQLQSSPPACPPARSSESARSLCPFAPRPAASAPSSPARSRPAASAPSSPARSRPAASGPSSPARARPAVSGPSSPARLAQARISIPLSVSGPLRPGSVEARLASRARRKIGDPNSHGPHGPVCLVLTPSCPHGKCNSSRCQSVLVDC
jgi:hypothetical protein